MRDNKVGFSRLGRAVAVIGIALGLMVVTTVPSQAVDVPWPTVPERYQPVVAIGSAVVVTGLAVSGTVISAPVSLPVGAFASLAYLTTGGSLTFNWLKSDFPQTEVNAEFTSYPTYTSNNLQATFSVQHPSIHPNNLADFIYRVGAFTDGQGVSYSGNLQAALGSTSSIQHPCSKLATLPCTGIIVQYQVKTSTGTNIWSTALSKTVANAPAVSKTVETAVKPNYNFGGYPNPDGTTTDNEKRAGVETKCGTTIKVTYGPSTTGTALVAPVSQKCPDGSLPDETNIFIEEKYDGVNWYKAYTDVVENGCTAANTSNPVCKLGYVGTIKPDPDTKNPADPNAECFNGSKACNTKVEKTPPGGTPQDCSKTNCEGFTADKDKVGAGTAPNMESLGWQCSFNGTSVPMTECYTYAPVTVNNTTNITNTTSTTTTNTDSCGFSVSCYAQALFVPNPNAQETRLNDLRSRFYATPFGIIPQAIGDFTAPFNLNVYAPNQSNCAGPTLTLPRNFGVTGTGVSGTYVIQPLYACDDTEMGKFAGDISETLRGFLAPTVYVTGGFIVFNTILSAMGLALPMFVRGMEVDESTGEVLSGNKWRTKNSTSRRVGPKQWRNTR